MSLAISFAWAGWQGFTATAPQCHHPSIHPSRQAGKEGARYAMITHYHSFIPSGAEQTKKPNGRFS
jgi:hypothetical protein